MSEMVERVARAIDIAMHMGCPSEHWDGREKWEQDRCRLYARAAIAAMREPTDEMVKPAIIEGGGYEDPGVQDKDVRHVWSVMIREALR